MNNIYAGERRPARQKCIERILRISYDSVRQCSGDITKDRPEDDLLQRIICEHFFICTVQMNDPSVQWQTYGSG